MGAGRAAKLQSPLHHHMDTHQRVLGRSSSKTNAAQQSFTQAVYHLTKSLDPFRPVIVNDGWEHTVSDILTLHDYEEKGQAFLERYRDHIDAILVARYIIIDPEPLLPMDSPTGGSRSSSVSLGVSPITMMTMDGDMGIK